jgi:hypothetical protein
MFCHVHCTLLDLRQDVVAGVKDANLALQAIPSSRGEPAEEPWTGLQYYSTVLM